MKRLVVLAAMAMVALLAVPEAALAETLGCTALDGPGCGGCPCEECVCELDDWCCDVGWDDICATECIDDCGGCPALENCGNGQCEADEFETCNSCPEDCGCLQEELCYKGACCTASCDGKLCGDDGCGGTCGECDAGFYCTEQFACEEIPPCEVLKDIACDDVITDTTVGKNNFVDDYSCVGWDESGPEVGFHFVSAKDDHITVAIEDGDLDMDVFLMEDSCLAGSCVEYGGDGYEFDVLANTHYFIVVDGYGGDAGEFTLELLCQSTCVPDCPAGFCGADGCGGDCTCTGDGEMCYEEQCCVPSCEGKVCGDSCGLDCGTCEAGNMCDETGQCVPLPECQIAVDISCDDVLDGDTTGFTSVIDEYSCSGWDESGPEAGFHFVSAVDDLVTVSVAEVDDDVDLDLFVLADACKMDGCVEYASTELSFDAVAGTHYYFVVDGYMGDVGAFSLTVKCQSTCVTDCEGKECGEDGCGGTCGECLEGVCGSGICQTGPGCETSTEPGCGGCMCEACVCEMDPYCCTSAWDTICVGECAEQCGGCPTFENCGDDLCAPEEFENCKTCPEDCACEDGENCFEGVCCVPSCEGQACGDDGCGGLCGGCLGPDECLGNGEASAADCGDVSEAGCCDFLGRVLYCMPDGLYCIDCAALQPECGWKADNLWYDCGTTGEEDPSGDNPITCSACDPPCEMGDKCVNDECVPCVPNCDGVDCGNDGCGGLCGLCPEGAECFAGFCQGDGPGCTPNEDGPGCGGCACEACVCEMDAYCCDTAWDGQCVAECIEQCGGCPVDPIIECGDGICNGDEDCDACVEDCGCDEGEACVNGACEACVPDCDGLECGDDGCGGSCGECDDGIACVDGLCDVCVPMCEGAVCGDDGCGGSCGACEDGVECVDGQCGCVPACDGFECGDDGCGATCGECGAGVECVDGLCVACVPVCEGLECGDDGCGGSCGECDQGKTCGDDGLCAGTTEDVVEDVPEEPEADVASEIPPPKEDSSGCSTTGTSGPSAIFLMLFALLGLALVRRASSRA